MLNLTGKDTFRNFKENNKQGYNNNYTINNLKTIKTNYGIAKNNYQDYNRTIDNNKYRNKDSNDNNSYNNNYTPKK